MLLQIVRLQSNIWPDSIEVVVPRAEVDWVVADAFSISPMPPKKPATMVLAVAAPILETTLPDRPTLLSESVTKPFTWVSMIAYPSLLRHESDTRRTSARSLSSLPTASAMTKQPAKLALMSFGKTAGVWILRRSGSGLLVPFPEVEASKPVNSFASINEGGR